MTNEFVVGILVTVQIASFGGFYIIVKSEIKRLEQKIDYGFENLKLELRLHEALHHHKEE